MSQALAGKSFRGVRGSAPRAGAVAPGSRDARAERHLGNTTKNPSKLAAQRLNQLRDQRKRDSRWLLQEAVRRVSHLARVCGCRRRRIPNDEPSIRRKDGKAHYAGVQLCGSIWACPLCGGKIRQRRAEEINTALVRFRDERIHWGVGREAPACPIDAKDQATTGTVYLLSLTLPHDFGEALGDLLPIISAAFSALVSGRRWWDDCERFAIVGYIRAHDSTSGANGWHPHFHVILLVSQALDASQLQQLRRRLYSRWVRAIIGRRPRLGRRGEAYEQSRRIPSFRHGVHIEEARTIEEVARYASEVAGDVPEIRKTVVVGEKKLGLELTRQDLKRGTETSRTPWEILRAIALAPTTCDDDGVVTTGPDVARDIRLWREWERETHGKQAIRWSKGLKRVFGVDDLSDEEIAAEEVGGDVVHQFDAVEWWAVCGNDGAAARLLVLAETQGAEAVRAHLTALVARFVAQKRHLPFKRRAAA